jgi:hypothetical protein
VEARILNILEFFGPLEPPLTGDHDSGRVEHLGGRRGPLHLQRHKGGGHEADAEHRYRGGERRACEQASVARVRNTDPGGAQAPQDERAAGSTAAAQAGPTAAVAVRPASGRRASVAEGQAVSKGVRIWADEVAMALEEDTLCTEGPANQHQGAAPGAATKAAGDAGSISVAKAKIVKPKSKLKTILCKHTVPNLVVPRRLYFPALQ